MRNPFRKLLVNWPWKLAALGVALVIFHGIRSGSNHTQKIAVAVEADIVEGGQALVGFEPAVVSVTFSGSESAIRQLSVTGSEPPRIRLNLAQPPAGASTVNVSLSHRDVLHNSDLRVASLEPSHVTAHFDTRDTRSFAVNEPIISGSPEAGVVIVSIDPKTVELTGSKLLMDELEASENVLSTSILDVSGRTEGFQTVLKVLPPDNRGGWTLRPDTVRADVKFVRGDNSRVFPKVPVQVLQSYSGQRYHPEPRTAEVTLQGIEKELQQIPPESLRLLLEEPEGQDRDLDGKLMCEPILVLPCTNRVSRVTVTPATIWLKPIVNNEATEE